MTTSRWQNKFSFDRILVCLIPLTGLYFILNMGLYKKENRVIEWDIISYYAYLPAFVIHEDVSLSFVSEEQQGKQYLFWPDENGVIKTTMGMAVLYSPFFLGAHQYAKHFDYPANGFSLPYKFALLLSTLVFLFLGLFYLRKILSQYFSSLITGLTMLCLVFGTGIYYYSTMIAPMPHVYNFALICMFLYYVKKWYETNASYKYTLIVGLLLGLISLIRITNVLVVIFLVCYGVSSLKNLKTRILFFLNNWPKVGLMALLFISVWIPQFLYYKTLTGQWFYYSYGDEGFQFLSFNFLKGLFAARNGWLIYAPIMMVAIAAIPLLKSRLRQYWLPTLIFVPLTCYLVLSWWCYWYTGLGNRAMLDLSGILALPLASGVEKIARLKKPLMFGLGALVLTFFLKGVQHSVQYHYNGLHFNSMTWDAYFHNFWKIKTDPTYWELLRAPDYEAAKKGVDQYADEKNKNLILQKASTKPIELPPASTHQLISPFEVYRTERYMISFELIGDTNTLDVQWTTTDQRSTQFRNVRQGFEVDGNQHLKFNSYCTIATKFIPGKMGISFTNRSDSTILFANFTLRRLGTRTTEDFLGANSLYPHSCSN